MENDPEVMGISWDSVSAQKVFRIRVHSAARATVRSSADVGVQSVSPFSPKGVQWGLGLRSGLCAGHSGPSAPTSESCVFVGACFVRRDIVKLGQVWIGALSATDILKEHTQL